MPRKQAVEWIPCSSRNDLVSRLKNDSAFAEFEEARDWGFFCVDEDSILAVGYTNFGINPSAFRIGENIIFGAGDYVANYSCLSKNIIYRYHVPTVFHEFVFLEENKFLIRDEICFVLVDGKGNEVWSFCPGIINEYGFNGNEIVGITDEGVGFKASIPGF